MPTIKEYNIQTSVPNAPQGRRTFAGPQQNALQIAGQTLSSLSEKAVDIWEAKDVSDAHYRASKANTEWAKRFEEMKKTAAPDGSGFTQSFEEQFDAYKSEQIGQLSSARGQQVLSDNLERVKGAYLNQGIDFQAKRFGNYKTVAETELVNDEINTVRSNPALLEQTLISAENRIKSDPFFREYGIAEQHLSETNTKLHDGALRGFVDGFQKDKNVQLKQVNQALAELADKEAHPWINNASPSVYSEAKNQLESLAKNLETRNKELFFVDFASEMNRMRFTGQPSKKFSESSITSMTAGDERQRAVMLREYKEAQATGYARAEIKEQSDPEVLKDLQARQARLGSEPNFDAAHQAYQAKASAYSSRLQMWKQDPAQSTLQDSDLARTRYDEVSKNPDAKTSDYEALGDVMIAEQSRIHPGQPNSLLTNQQASVIQNALDSVNSQETGPQTALQILKAEQQKWGKHWNTVLGDMRTQLKLSDEAFVVTNLVSVSGKEQVSEQLLKASQKYGKDAGMKDVEKKTRGDFFKAAQESLEPLRESLTGIQNSDEIYSSYRDAIASLATYRSYLGGGKNTDVAAITREVVGDMYEFKGSYFVPKTPGIDPEQIEAGTFVIQKDLFDGNTKIVIPPSVTGLDDAQRDEWYRDSLRAGGRWANAPGNNGLRFLDSRGAEVKVIENGVERPMIYSFQELQSLQPSNTKTYRESGFLTPTERQSRMGQ